MTRNPPDHPELMCGTGSWDASSYGNHRIAVRVDASARAVTVDLPWRRRDPDPAKIDVIVLSARSAQRIKNVVRLVDGRESGRLVFEPVDGPGEYHVYYLPYVHRGSQHYPCAEYRIAFATADPGWVHADVTGDDLPCATPVRYEAASSRDSFAPMGFAATPTECDRLLDEAGVGCLVFGEPRERPILEGGDPPARWADEDAPRGVFRGSVDRGEIYAFQVGVYAAADLGDVEVDPTGLPYPAWSLAGTVTLEAGRVRAVWVLVEVPADATPGRCQGTVLLRSAGAKLAELVVDLDVTEAEVPAGGVDEPHRMARLAWLDSSIAEDDDVVAPFRPVTVAGRTATILGRSVELHAGGLPARVVSTFTPTVASTAGPPRELLDRKSVV